MVRRCAALLLVLLLAGCVRPPDDDIAGVRAELTQPERLERSRLIREAAAANGITNGLLLAGIALAETGMAHCWSEATWACMGPYSDDCMGPVIAGAADGPCSDMQGGLGMFQFDAGTFDQTLAREGDRILSIAGNVAAAVDFVLAMIQRSVYIDAVDTREQAIAWLNEVRPWNELFHPWIQTVTHYYNGCRPGVCSVYDSRYAGYRGRAVDLLVEQGVDFWYDYDPPCGPIPADGATLDERDACFAAGGDPQWWRIETGAGYDGTLLWTNATASADVSNYAVWFLRFVEAGSYRVEVHTPAAFAESAGTVYRVRHAGIDDDVPLDQSAFDGWQELGVFDFAAGEGQQVRVDDNTGEDVSTMTSIVADAIRLTPVSGPPPPPDDAGTPTGDGGVPGDAALPPGTDGGTGMPLGSGCGCRVSSGRDMSYGALLVALALLWVRRRAG